MFDPDSHEKGGEAVDPCGDNVDLQVKELVVSNDISKLKDLV